MAMSINSKAVADKVLELNEVDDYLGILNIPSTSKETMLTMKSDLKLFKKNYLKLSLIIHPDRMDKSYDNATKAFQTLVKAYEILSTPELIEEIKNQNDKNKKKMNAISRSNEGCYRTRVCCPRCQQPWSENTLDGNPTYFYTFLMTGLKQYTCSTCLCEFGCMTAIHKCPHCNKQFDYLPSDYHNKIICYNDNCKKDFGFMLYHASDRVIKDLKTTIKEEQEKASRATEAKRRRAMRGSRGMDKQTIELSFLMGMSDICPRCGEDFTEMTNDGDDNDDNNINQQKLHLMHCTDTIKHQKYEQVKKKAENAVIVKQVKKDNQDAIQSLASWEFLGGSNGQLWLLNEDQLKAKALSLRLDTKGDKDTLIDRIVNSTQMEQLLQNESMKDGENDEYSGSSNDPKKRKLLLTMESTDDSLQKKENCSASSKNCTALVMTTTISNNKKHQQSSSSSSSTAISTYRRSHAELSHQDIPSNYSSYDSNQLRSIIASQGLLSQLPKRAVKKDMLVLLERRIFIDKDDDHDNDEDVVVYISD